MPNKLLYEARTALVPWVEGVDEHEALHFIIEGRNADFFLCQGDADAEDVAFWQAVGRLWTVAPLMQLRLKEARDAIATMPPDALGVASAPYIGDQYVNWYIRDELLEHIDDALKEAKGE